MPNDIKSSQDLLRLIIQTMELFERLPSLTGSQKKTEVINSVTLVLHKYVKNETERKYYEKLIPILIESVIVISHHKLLVNKVNKCFSKWCF